MGLTLPREQSVCANLTFYGSSRTRPARRVPVHTRNPANDVPRPTLDDATVCRFRIRRGNQPEVQVSAGKWSNGIIRGLRPANTDGIRFRPSARIGRSPQGGRSHRYVAGYGAGV